MRRTSLMVLISIIVLITVGCGSTQWIPHQRPETPEERIAVAKHESLILSKIPQELSGHDQDWDDAIAAAHRIAVKTWCKTRLYEFQHGFSGRYTGRFKELEHAQ